MIKNLLVNESNARLFLEKVLYPLQDDEVFIFLLFARKKYHPNATDEWVYFRDIIKDNDIDQIIRKIKRYSFIADDCYTDMKTNKSLPIEAFVWYIDLSPKSILKAYRHFSNDMNNMIYEICKNPNGLKNLKKIKSKLTSSIHKSNSYKPYILVDMDTKDRDIFNKVLKILEDMCIWISETRGGYHFIIKRSRENRQLIFKNFFEKKLDEKYLLYCEIKNNVMTPISGTLQGGFEVKPIFI